MKITILGGGIGGLTAAIALRKAGISCELYEAADAFHPVGAGIGLTLNAFKALEIIGLADAVAAHGLHYDEARMLSTKGKTIQQLPMKRLKQRYHSASVTIHRHVLHRVLADRLEDTPLHFGKRLSRIERRNKEILLSFADGSQVSTEYLLAADGIHSVVRKTLLPGSDERYSKQTCWRGICNKKIASVDPLLMTETWGLGKRFGIAPLSENKLYWYAVLSSPEELQDWATLDMGRLEKLFENFHSPVAEIIRNTRQEDVFWSNLYDFAPIRKFAFDNILLLGDAAHATTPNLGQGACMAIEDAAVLSLLLGAKMPAREAFAAFEQLRIKRTSKIVNTSNLLGKVAQTDSPLLAGLRNAVFPLVPFWASAGFYDFLFGIDLKKNIPGYDQ
jgi:2-polyprenyl-6-methoxyphenol hydroxylase-like FAD-dependent oxidoreductase